MQRAYSYLRFSRPEQMKGDSIRRQSQLAREYAIQNNLELDESTFRDLGISAHRGENARTGSLGAFLKGVDDGIIQPGSWLLVESLDRVSRQDPWDAMPVFQQIINAGITVVTLQDQKVYSREKLRNNPIMILESLFVMLRAHEESATKSIRLSAAWENKRAKAANGLPITGKCPAWLELDRKAEKFNLTPERAKIVREIFDLFLAGDGQDAIAKKFNARKLPTWGRAGHWHKSYINKILKSRTVIGEYLPHKIEYDDSGKKTRVPTEPIPDYYPAAVDSIIFIRAQELQQPSAGIRGRKSQQLTNPFSMVAFCPACGSRMIRVNKGGGSKHPYRYLVCGKAKAGADCEGGYRTVRLEPLVGSFFSGLSSHLQEVPTDAPVMREIEEKRRAVRAELWRLQEMKELIKDAVLSGQIPPGFMGQDAARLERETAVCESLDKKLSAVLDSMRPRLIENKLKELARLADEKPLDITAVNAALRGLFDRLVIDYDGGRVLGYLRHTEDYVLERIYAI